MARSKIPHSWSIGTWPADVYPHDPARARWLLRAQRDELTAAGALARVGRELVILGDRYTRWLERQSANVVAYECPANKARAQS